MADYNYTKATVDLPALKIEIDAEAAITTALTAMKYDGPDSLVVSFATDLSGPEQTALDAVVAAHDGTPLNEYVGWCDTCKDTVIVDAKTEPTVCPVDGGEFRKIVKTADVIQLPILTERKGTSSASYEELARFPLDLRLLPNAANVILVIEAYKEGGGNGRVQLYNATDGGGAPAQVVDAADPTIYTRKFPLSGSGDRKAIQIRGKTDGTGTLHLVGVTLEIY
jgi:hypothetical protein